MAVGFVKKKLTFLFCDVTSQDHMIERSLVFMGGSFSQPPTKFGVLRHCGSRVMIFLVVEERNSKRSSDSAISIFSKSHVILTHTKISQEEQHLPACQMEKTLSWSHVPCITNDEMYTKKLLSVRPKLRREGKREKNIKAFCSTPNRKKQKKKIKAIAKLFCITQKR